MSLGSFMPFYLVHMLNKGMALRLLNYSEHLFYDVVLNYGNIC